MTQEETDFVLQSPWLHQLNRTRPVASLTEDIQSDIAIIGGGIAGVSTAYFILKNTKHNVVLIEGGNLANGATGHNAGQLVSYFETPFSKLVRKYGLKMAAEGQRAIESAWMLMEQIFNDTQLRTPHWIFTGYAAAWDPAEILVHLKNNYYRLKAGLATDLIMVAEEAKDKLKIPKRYNSVFAYMPHKNILDLLETDDKKYVAALPGKKGCMNSALFCEELVGFLLAFHSDRFRLCEQTPINQVLLENDSVVLSGDKYVVKANKVVLCTNGFEQLTILNKAGNQVNKDFHKMVRGSVGYMAGYLEPYNKPPTAISYLPEKQSGDAFASDPYFYLTRRPFEMDGNRHNLICVGGPEALMDDTNGYYKSHPYPIEAQNQIDSFLHKTFRNAPKKKVDYKFKWHGLMGYTPSGVRVIGPDPVNKVLMYNLGCNGVGLMHSIYGGQKISQFLQGDKLPRSIFDPTH